MDKIFHSKISVYRNFFIYLILFIILVNIIFNKYISTISFINLFLLLIPNWIFVFFFYKKETKRIKSGFYNYLEKEYNDKLTNFLNNYYNPSNPDSKDILELFSDKELLKDEYIFNMKNEINKIISLFVFTSAITILFFLISTVFIMRKYYIDYVIPN